MPFTISHAAALLPFTKRIENRLYRDALIVGSFAPDLPYLFPFGIPRMASHDPCMGWVVYLPLAVMMLVLNHFLYRPFLLSYFGLHLERYSAKPYEPCSSSLMLVPFLILAGAYTHLAWDSFTHPGTWMTVNIDFIGNQIVSIGNTPIYGYKILQHLSSILGLMLVFIAATRVFPLPSIATFMSTHFVRIRWLVVLVILIPFGISVTIVNSLFDIHDFVFTFMPISYVSFTVLAFLFVMTKACAIFIPKKRAPLRCKDEPHECKPTGNSTQSN